MINYEIKSHLAKLLATEDLVVEHQNVDTAQFNVETRVLTLPLWKKASTIVELKVYNRRLQIVCILNHLLYPNLLA